MVISGRGARQALLKVVAASVVIMVTGAANAACLPVTLQEHVIDMGDVVYTPGLPTLRVKDVRKEYNALVVGDEAGCLLTPVALNGVVLTNSTTNGAPVLRRLNVHLNPIAASTSGWDQITGIDSNGNIFTTDARIINLNNRLIREITGGHGFGSVVATGIRNPLPFSGSFRMPIYEFLNENGQVVWRVVIAGTGRYIPILLTTDNVNVTLPNISSTDLQGPGSVAGRTIIPLSIISEDVVSQNFISFDANMVTSGNIIIPDLGADTGVGFQIVNTSSGTPVQLGQPQLVPGNINGVFENFSVQYIQVADSVNGGQVSAVVTMTLTYQ